MKGFISLPQKKPSRPASKKPASALQLKKMVFPEVHIAPIAKDDSAFLMPSHYGEGTVEELLQRIRRYVWKNGGSTASIRTRVTVFGKSVNKTPFQKPACSYEVIIILGDLCLIVMIQHRKTSNDTLPMQYSGGRTGIIYKTTYSFADFKQWFDCVLQNLKLIDHE